MKPVITAAMGLSLWVKQSWSIASDSFVGALRVLGFRISARARACASASAMVAGSPILIRLVVLLPGRRTAMIHARRPVARSWIPNAGSV